MTWSPLNRYIASVAAAAGVVLAALIVWEAPASGSLLTMALFATAFVLVQLFPLPIPRRQSLELVRLEEAVVIPLVLALNPAEAMLALGAGILAGHLIARAPLSRIVFNVSQMMIATAACAVCARTLVEPGSGWTPMAMGAAVVGLVVMFAINQALVSGVISLAGGGKFRRLLTDDFGLHVMMWSANASLGLMLVLPYFHAPWLLLVSFVPLIVLHASYRAQIERSREDERLRALTRRAHTMNDDLSVKRVALQLVQGSLELVNAGQVELRIHGDENVYIGDGNGGRTLRAADVPGTPGPQGPHLINLPLTGRSGFSGILTVRRVGTAGVGAIAFSGRDRTLLDMLSRQAETALDNAWLFQRVTAERHKFAKIFEHSTEGLLVLSGAGRVVSWNPALTDICGFTAEDMVDSPIALISPDLSEAISSDDPGTVDAVMAALSGERRHVRASFAQVPSDEPGAGGRMWVVVIRDVTRERETERLKDDFVATISHELRTPLTSIKGFLETMLRDEVELSAEQTRVFTEIMCEQASRLERLIADLLDMSAIESGRSLKLQPSTVDLNREVDLAVMAFRSAHPHVMVNVTHVSDPVSAYCDRHRVHQVLTNLLDNARKHGSVDDPVLVQVDEQNGTARFSVSDSGEGIASEELGRIFERFYCTSDSATRTGGGAGLGLFISRKLLDAMGGDIHVTSTRGVGSTFSVDLPGDEETAAAVIGRATTAEYSTESPRSDSTAPRAAAG